MTVTGTGADPLSSEPGAHRLLIADTDEFRRVGAAAWVGRELARGAKVYYKGWLPDGARPEQHWIVGPGGPPAAATAFHSGQLEFADVPAVIERSGGTVEGLFRLQTDEVERALDEGWPSVAMSQETPHHPMADDAQAADYTATERGYEVLADRFPLTVLCQLTIDEENPRSSWESTAVHHRWVSDATWFASHTGDRWCLGGMLDAHVAGRFSAALHGALTAARDAPWGPDLHIDASGVDFFDFACAQIVKLHAHSTAHDQRIVLHGSDAMMRKMVGMSGQPGSVLFDDEGVWR